jgi:hypothetical protein
MLDAAFPGQQCARGLGAKLDDKGSIGWQRGGRLRHSLIPKNGLWVCVIFALSSVEDDRVRHLFRDTAGMFNFAAAAPLLFKYRSSGGEKGYEFSYRFMTDILTSLRLIFLQVYNGRVTGATMRSCLSHILF